MPNRHRRNGHPVNMPPISTFQKCYRSVEEVRFDGYSIIFVLYECYQIMYQNREVICFQPCFPQIFLTLRSTAHGAWYSELIQMFVTKQVEATLVWSNENIRCFVFRAFSRQHF